MSELVKQYRHLVFDQSPLLTILFTGSLLLIAICSLCIQWLLRGYVPHRREHTTDEARDVRFAVLGATVTLIWKFVLAAICILHAFAEYDKVLTIKKSMVTVAAWGVGCAIFGVPSWIRLLRESRQRD